MNNQINKIGEYFNILINIGIIISIIITSIKIELYKYPETIGYYIVFLVYLEIVILGIRFFYLPIFILLKQKLALF